MNSKATQVKTNPLRTAHDSLVHTISEIRASLLKTLSRNTIIVALMLIASSLIMATAWLGHLRFKNELSFFVATLFAWILVLPEYMLNIIALRRGHSSFTGGQMAGFRLCCGVICVALVSHYFLGEAMTTQKILGFVVMMVSIVLILSKKKEG